MAKSRIKGITVEIGGDVTGLDAALKDVNKRTKEVQSELKDVERLLKFDPNNVELLAQRQQLLTEAIQSSTEKLNQLRAAQSQVEEQFRSGQIGEEQYRAFRREVQATEQQLSGYQQALTDMNSEHQRVQQGTRDLQTLFDATGTSVSDYANVIGQRLVRAIQNGTATSRDLEYSFQRIGQQAIGAGGDIERLRASLQSVDSGNSIQNVRRDLQQLQSEAENTAESVDGISDSLKGMAGALVAGGGIAGAIEQALDMSKINTKIDISMEVPESSKASIKEAVRNVVAYGVDGEEALEAVRRQWALNKDASDEANASIIKQAGAVASAYAGIDLIELIQETNEIGASLKISNEEAIALTNALLKAGFPPEQLDTISEYGTQMQLAGFNAKEVQSIFEAGIDTKTWNIDNLNDGVKEARLTMAGFGLEVDDSIGKMVEQTGISAKKFQDWGKAVAAGGEGGSKAMSEVATWLDSIDNKELKNELATKVFGTKWEDQGDNMIAVFNGVADAADKTKENLSGINDVTDRLDADPAVKMQQAFQDVKAAAEPVLAVVADIISKIAEWISGNPKLAATIATIVTGLGILIGVLFTLAPIFTAITGAAGALSIGILPIIGIVTGVAAGIAALIAIGVLLYQNWDAIKAKCVEVWGSIKEWFSKTWTDIKTGTSEMWESLKVWLAETWESIKQTASDVWTALKQFFVKWWDEILAVFTGPIGMLVYLIVHNWDAIKKKTSEIWNSIKAFFKDTWEGIKSTFNSVVSSIRSFIDNSWNKMKLSTQTAFNTIKSNTQSIWTGIKTWLSTTVESIKNTIRDKFESLKNTVQDKMNTVRSKIEEIWRKSESFLRNVNLISIGKDIIQGLINGLSSKTQAVYNKISEIAGNIKKKFTGLFDIHSPSRVFMGYGENLNEGLIKGIQSSSSQLNKAVDNVYGSLANSASHMTNLNNARNFPHYSEQVRNNQPITLTINPAPVFIDGMNVGQIDFNAVEDGLASNFTRRLIVNGVKPRR